MTGPNTANTRFLVVDDFSTMRKVIRALLKDLGYANSDEAQDGFAALTKLKTGKFDFVISDWNMPNMNGLTLLQEIRSDPILCETPVLLITADTKKDKVLSAAKEGANGYVVKPLTAAKLQEKLEQIFDKIGRPKMPGV